MSVIDKAFDLFKKSKSFYMGTVDADGLPQIRIMGSQVIEKHVIYTTSFAMARKIEQIKKHPQCQFLFHSDDMKSYGTFSGKAELVSDIETKKALYKSFGDVGDYFKGPEDPNFGLIKFTPKKVELWKMGSMKPEVAEI